MKITLEFDSKTEWREYEMAVNGHKFHAALTEIFDGFYTDYVDAIDEERNCEDEKRTVDFVTKILKRHDIRIPK